MERGARCAFTPVEMILEDECRDAVDALALRDGLNSRCTVLLGVRGRLGGFVAGVSIILASGSVSESILAQVQRRPLSQQSMPRSRPSSRSHSPVDRSDRRYRDGSSKDRNREAYPSRSHRRSRSPRRDRNERDRSPPGVDARAQRRREREARDISRDKDNAALVPRKRSASPSRSKSPINTKPNFAPSGLLAAATNTVVHDGGKSTVLKYNEPPEARKPTQSWRLYTFKGKDEQGISQLRTRISAVLTVDLRCPAHISPISLSNRKGSASP